MDLRTSTTPWIAGHSRPPARPALAGSTRCQVAVVGGGITGALIADALTARGMDVLLLDQRQPGTGSTAASTALLSYELDVPLRTLSRTAGTADAVQAYRLGRDAVAQLGELAAELGDGCGFARRSSVYLASDANAVQELREEFTLRRQHGFDLEWLDETAVRACFSFRRPAALLTREAAEVDPVRLTHALLQRAEVRGARIHAHTPVQQFAPLAAGGARLTAQSGLHVRADHVVFATGYETRHFPGVGRARLRSTYALASEPLAAFPGWHERALLWETDRPYLYLRTTSDGRALIGGLDDAFTTANERDARLPAKRAQLEQAFRELFPAIPFRTEFAWAGTFAETADGLPYIGPHPDLPGALFCLSYGGNGITFGIIAANLIGELVRGRNPADAALFRFGRASAE